MTLNNLTDEQIDEEAFNEAFIAVFGVGQPKADTPSGTVDDEDDLDTLTRAWEAASGDAKGQVAP